MSPRNWIQVIKFGSKHLFPLSYLTSSHKSFYFFSGMLSLLKWSLQVKMLCMLFRRSPKPQFRGKFILPSRREKKKRKLWHWLLLNAYVLSMPFKCSREVYFLLLCFVSLSKNIILKDKATLQISELPIESKRMNWTPTEIDLRTVSKTTEGKCVQRRLGINVILCQMSACQK